MAYNLESLIRVLDETMKQQPETGRERRTLMVSNINSQESIIDKVNQNKSRALLESLFEKVCSLKHLLENNSHIIIRGSNEMEVLEREIRDAAHEAEDIIESNTLDQLLSNPSVIISFLIFPKKLSKVIKKLDVAREELMKLIKDQSHDTMDAAATMITSDVADDPISSKQQDTVLGFDQDTLQLKDRLTTQTSNKLTVVPIVGMGGIGKTTLSRNLYNDTLILTHFHVRAWVTVSQDYNIKKILLVLLGCIIENLSDELKQQENGKLALLLYQSLYGKRYLIVVDDIWSAEAWDEIKMFFPKESHGSRILLTTRVLNVAKHADLSCEEHQMHLLNNLQSWELLQHKVFGKDHCPPSLEGVGKRIANNCGGLPLVISVIGGLLLVEKNSKDFWEQIARGFSSVIAENDEHISKILTLSYNHLPHHLRPCLLYMAAFPEDYEVRASKLTKLWLAEGLLKKKPISESTYLEEEVGEEYLKALVDRNLLSIQKYKSNGKAKSYSIHDLLRELCVKKARQEKFMYVRNQNGSNIQKEYSIRRVSVHLSFWKEDVNAFRKYMPLTRSFLCTGYVYHFETVPVIYKMKLLRVLDVYGVLFNRFPKQILQLVNLRFLAFSMMGSCLRSEISRLRNLQILILGRYHGVLPSQLWEMLEPRHIKLTHSEIKFEPMFQLKKVQAKLQTLSLIRLDDLVRTGMLTKIPNIKKLEIYEGRGGKIADLSHLHNLETLMFLESSFCDTSGPLPKIEFPPFIKKLTLDRCMISNLFLSTLCTLPNLQVLKIRKCLFIGGRFTYDAEWEPEGEFQSLQFLLLEELNLVYWKVDDTHFPRLRHLVIKKCAALEGIPNSIGDIATLEKIELDESNSSLVASARQIEEQQSDCGNESLKIMICK